MISQRICSVPDTPTKESTPAKGIPVAHWSVKSGTHPDKTFGICGELFHGVLIVLLQDIMVFTPALKIWDHGSPAP